MRLRIDLAYDGEPFAGFARQRDQITVQGTLEGALSRLTGIDEPWTTVAGRTDRGVHALGQVCHVDVDPDARRAGRFVEDLAASRERLDHLVGEAITIWSITEVADDFDARFSATGRRYRYRLLDDVTIDPRLRRLAWHVGAPLDVDAMHSGVQHLVGEHDFASFCRKADGGHTVRSIEQASVIRAPADGVLGAPVEVRLAGKAFCHQQVRAITGCLVEVGLGKRPNDWIAEVLAAQDRRVAARVAPPHGLTLERVDYGEEWPPSPLRGSTGKDPLLSAVEETGARTRGRGMSDSVELLRDDRDR